jgi:PAS domain S-box-containing protein
MSPDRATPSGRWRSVDTRGPLRRAAAFLAAGAVLAGLVGWLLVENYRASAARRADVLRQHAARLHFQSQAVGHVLDTAERALRQVGDSAEVAGFLESLDLGMSEEYGLALARGAAQGRLELLVRPVQVDGTSGFDRVVLLDERGRELATAAVDGERRAVDWTSVIGERDGLSLSPDGSHLVAVQSLQRNRANAGFLVGWLDGRAASRALAGDPRGDAGAMRVHLVDGTGGTFRPAGAVEGAALPRGAPTVPDDGRMVELADPSIRDGRPMLVSRVRVPGRSLYLVHVVEAGDLFRAVPSESAAAYLAAGAALVLGAVGLAVFLNVRSLLRRTRQEASSARERELGEKDEALEREAAERQRIERSRAVLANALEQSADAVAITDTALRIEHVNPAFERLTGRSAAELLGTGVLDALAPGETGSQGAQPLVESLGRGEAWRGALLGARGDGTPYDAKVSATPVRDDAGTVTNHVFSARDVTEEKRERELRRHAQRLEAIGTLAGGVAHDFNNILTAINGYAALAADAVPPDDPVREDLEEIRLAGARAADLTRQLLAFGRRQVLRSESIDLNGAVSGVQKMIGRLIGEHIDLVTDLQPDAWRIRGDRGQIEQVLVNLAVNARDAMPAGGRLSISTANVRVSEAEARHFPEGLPGAFVRLRVSDTGVGMEPEVLARAFEPFYTTKDQGKGTGLGLSTVYGIVRQSQGFIGAASAPGAGATFDVFLPRDPKPPGVEVAPRSRTAGARGSGQVILVAEDEEQVRSLVVAQLASRGFAVLSAADGREALRIAEQRRERIDVLLADVVMPRIAGPELAQMIVRKHPETSVVFMSGYAEEAVVRVGSLRPGASFISKPFDVDDLCELLRTVLEKPREAAPPT